jgi:hypothetical protein
MRSPCGATHDHRLRTNQHDRPDAGLAGQERDLAIAKQLGIARSTVYQLLEPAQAA